MTRASAFRLMVDCILGAGLTAVATPARPPFAGDGYCVLLHNLAAKEHRRTCPWKDAYQPKGYRLPAAALSGSGAVIIIDEDGVPY